MTQPKVTNDDRAHIMILTLQSYAASLVLAGTGNAMAPLKQIEHLIDICAQTSRFEEAAALFSKFHRAADAAELQDLCTLTKELNQYLESVRNGEGDPEQWLMSINIFFQNLQSGDFDTELEVLARHPEATKILA